MEELREEEGESPNYGEIRCQLRKGIELQGWAWEKD